VHRWLATGEASDAPRHIVSAKLRLIA
jgi:hypothetical protein